MAALMAPPEARRILELAQSDRPAAQKAFAELSPERQVALVCETPVARRAGLLALAADPGPLVRALPPAELCFVVNAVGLNDAGWLLEQATDDQLTTCVDLDAWTDWRPDVKRTGEWLAAFAECGDDTLVRGAHAVDMELWVLHLQQRVVATLKSNDDDWEPPAGGKTLDGQFYLVAHDGGDDLADLLAFLRVLFERDYWFYFRLLQAVSWELPTETAEWALRWRSGRLQDLGFPPPDDARRIYTVLGERARLRLPDAPPAQPGEWPLPVWMPRFPVGADATQSIYQALAELPDAERRPHLLAFLALANRIAIADGLELGDAESLPAALEKAAALASLGIDLLASHHGLTRGEVLRRSAVERLFTVGVDQLREQAPEAAAKILPPPRALDGEDDDAATGAPNETAGDEEGA